MYEYYLFDLDGTLTDPGEGITKSVAYALRQFGIDIPDRTVLYAFIGPPLRDSFSKYYGFSEDDAEKAVAFYREYFSEKGLYENKLYPQIPDTLDRLRKIGRKLAVATSKPEKYARIILDYFDLTKYFDYICGASMDKSRDRKADVIRYALRNMNITDLSRIVMVGDRDQDINGARENGIDSIGVLYGYGNKKELTEAGADHIAASPEELLNI